MKNLLFALTLLISFFLSAQTSAFDIDAASKFIEDSEKELLETEKILKEFRDRGDLGPTYEFLRVNYLKSKKNLETAKDAHSRLIEGQEDLRNAELWSNALQIAKSKRQRRFLIILVSTLILVIIVVYLKRQKKLNQ